MTTKQTLTLERTYAASLDALWDLWTTKAGFESWWGPQGFRVEVQELDARPGGALRYDMIAATEEMIAAMAAMGAPASHPTASVFTEVQPKTRLMLTNTLDFIPGVEAYESHILAEFEALPGGQVKVRITLDALHSEEWTGRQLEGMTSQLTKLDARYGGAA